MNQNQNKKTSTPIIIAALREIANNGIRTDDGVVEATIYEAADRLEELHSAQPTVRPLFDPRVDVKPDNEGAWSHPDVPILSYHENIESVLEQMGFRQEMLDRESDSPSSKGLVDWHPKLDGWQLVGKWTTEDADDVALFVKPISGARRYFVEVGGE